MIKLQIETTDIFLDDLGPNQGKITVSDSWRGAFTYYWGAMGGDLSDFLQRINGDYFAGKLCRTMYRFSLKGTLRNLRQQIREELPWYEEMEAQKELRREIRNELESCTNEGEFVDSCIALPKYLSITGYNYQQEQEFIERIKDIFTCEPWGYIQEEPSNEYKWLKDLHSKIKKELSKNQLAQAS